MGQVIIGIVTLFITLVTKSHDKNEAPEDHLRKSRRPLESPIRGPYKTQGVHACMDAWMHGCMHAWMHGWMDGWMHGWMDGWTDGWMDDGWMNG